MQHISHMVYHGIEFGHARWEAGGGATQVACTGLIHTGDMQVIQRVAANRL
jgi:hypothetical protein